MAERVMVVVSWSPFGQSMQMDKPLVIQQVMSPS